MRTILALLALSLALPSWANFKAVRAAGKTGGAGRIDVIGGSGLGNAANLPKVSINIVPSISAPITPQVAAPEAARAAPGARAAVSVELPASQISGVVEVSDVSGTLPGVSGNKSDASKGSGRGAVFESERVDDPKDFGRMIFDGAKKKSGFDRFMDALMGRTQAAPKAPKKLSHRVESLGLGTVTKGYTVNGEAAEVIGFGSFKTSLRHPRAPSRTIKVFDAKNLTGPLSLRERNLDITNTNRLASLGVVPRIHDAGFVKSGERFIGFVDEELVSGSDLSIMTPTKYKYVKRLFEILAENGVLIADLAIPVKLRANIKVGTTASSADFKAWLVDRDASSPKDLSKAQLRAIYAKALKSLEPTGAR